MHTKITIASTLLLLTLSAAAQPPGVTPAGGTWDIDGDGLIGMQEFGDAYDRFGGLTGWDADSSGTLSEAEFRKGLTETSMMDVYDLDGDGVLEKSEMDQRFGGMASMERWDSDANGTLNRSEIYDGLYDAMDADSDRQLSDEELQKGWYAVWNTDDTPLDVAELSAGLALGWPATIGLVEPPSTEDPTPPGLPKPPPVQ